MNEQKVHLLIIRGLPGSGKSTLAKNISKSLNVAHFENDAYLMHDDKYVFTPEDAKKAATQCFNDTINCLKAGHDAIVSNVFVTRKSIDKYANAAKALGAEVQVWRCTADYGNVHDVPSNVLASMKAGFQNYNGEKIIRK